MCWAPVDNEAALRHVPRLARHKVALLSLTGKEAALIVPEGTVVKMVRESGGAPPGVSLRENPAATSAQNVSQYKQ